MKALSLRQPWAAAVLYLGKRIENRRWNTSFRGQFLIHAAKGMTRAEHQSAIEFCDDVLELPHPMMNYADISGVMAFDKVDRGGIVGTARLVAVIPPCKVGLLGECEHKWHMPEQFGFVLEEVRTLPFTPLSGALGFHEVPPAILEKLGLR